MPRVQDERGDGMKPETISARSLIEAPAMQSAVLEPAIDAQRAGCDCTECLAGAVLLALKVDLDNWEERHGVG